MNEQEYLEFPWSMEDTVENMKFIKEVEQERMLTTNLDGMGEKDAEELGFDFDRAIEALEKQIPKKPIYEADGYADGELVYDSAECPNCGHLFEYDINDWESAYCLGCGQALDWSEFYDTNRNRSNQKYV